MTVLEAFKNCLIESNKVQAPSLLLDDWIYLFNKGVQKWYNKRYNLFETSQQLTDDLRVFSRTLKIDYTSGLIQVVSANQGVDNVFGTSYTCKLPGDYVHILSCICQFKDLSPKCSQCGTFQIGANKLDSAEWPHSIDNYYMKPSIERPYYYISNILDPVSVSTRNRKTGTRYGNTSIPTMLIKCGNNLEKYHLDCVYVDYLRSPQYISLTLAEIDDVTDLTQELEFPDYVTYEIINEIITLMLENGHDPRILTQPAISQSIGPVQK